ncbi:MAG: GH92 family glycosyl hydrolase, partial [Saprospiraceae bacterium]
MSIKNYFALLSLAILLSFFACKDSTPTPIDLADFIDPFIGTGGHGHTFPGATMPFGMVQLSPDTRLEGWDGCGGYHFTDSIVYGFSHTHLSGTGVSDYGDILLMPTTGELRLNNGADGTAGYRSRFEKNKEVASAGYYQTYLEDHGVGVELTASPRAGMHRYTFENKATEGNVIVDLKHRDQVLNGKLHVISDTELAGVRISNAWAKEQHLYFVIKFSEAFAKDKISIDADSLVYGFKFDLSKEKKLSAKVGISAVSIEGARKNLSAEMPAWDFAKHQQQAKTAWSIAMNKIEVSGGSEAQQTIFYTAMYHAMIAPNLYQDIDGQYRGMDLKVHQAEDHTNYTIFSLWDTYRGTHPLYTLIETERTNDFIKTFLKQFEAGGILPIWELSANYTGCMIGYHSIPVIADAYQKGIRGFDAKQALAAMQVSAEENHLGLDSYKKWGYIPSNEEAESVSKTLEYAYDDWCIAMMAKSMGEGKIYKKYLKRAQSYKNIFDPTTGFMRAKLNNGFVANFNPAEVNFHYTEANSWQYSFYAPQDIKGFYTLMGGKDNLEQKLDQL